MDVILSGVTSFLGIYTAAAFLQEGHRVYGIARPGSKHLSRLEPLQDMGLRQIFLDFDQLDSCPDATDAAHFPDLPEKLPSTENSETPPRHIPQIPVSETSKNPESASGRNTSPAPVNPTASPERVFLHFSWDGVGSAGRSDPLIQKRNFENACKAYRLAESWGCHKFLFAGSQAEYGRGTRDCPQPVSEYGKAKLRFGTWGLEMPSPMQFLHLRIFSVYGRGDHETSLVRTVLDALLSGCPVSLGPCTQLWNYMEARDCAAALLLLATHASAGSGLYDIAGEETKPLRAFVEEMADVAEAVNALDAMDVADTADAIDAADTRPLGSLRDLLRFGTRGNNAEGAADMHPDTRALRNLGFRCRIPFSEGIREILQDPLRYPLPL